MGTHRRSYRSAYDVAIVGGGHNGLVAGAYLARAGLSVLIVEQRDKVGGLCATEEVIPGYKANLAANSAHNLDPRIIYDLKLREHGLQFRFVEPSSFTLFDSGKKLIGWSDKHQLTESIGRFSRADMKGHFEALNALSTFGELLDVSFFAPAPRMSELVARLRTPAEERAFASIAFGSATDFVSDYLESSELRASMTLVAVTGTMMGPSTPGSAYGLAHRALYRGSTAVKRRHLASELDTESSTAPFSKGTPLGGMGAVARALERSFLALGGEIEVGVSVAEIRYENGLATGIVLESGDEIEARFVVSNANPKTTLLQLLPPDALSDEQRGPLEAADMKGCMSKVIIALDRKPQFAPENAHENELLQTAGFRLCPSIAQMDRDAERARAGQWYEEPVVFGLLQSAVDPTLAPEGRHLLSLSVGGSPYQLADGTWASRRDDWAKHVIAAVDRFVPGLASTVVDYHCVTPLDLERDFGLTNGHLTHGDLTSDLLLRWGPIPGFGGAATPIGGLYLCSVGVWPANFVSGIPGENAARAILAALSEANRVRRKPERLDISDVTDIGVS